MVRKSACSLEGRERSSANSMFFIKNRDTSERTLCPISHAVNAVQVNSKQQGGKGAPLFHAKKWLDSRRFIPIQQRVFISIIQVFEDGQHVGEHLVLTKVVPQFASRNGVIGLFEINEGCVQP